VGVIVDTSVLVAAERTGADLELAEGEEVGLSTVVLMEYWKGVERANSSTRRRRRIEFFERVSATFRVLPVTAETAVTAAGIWSDLVRAGTMIGAVDLLIAAAAIERDWTLATHDRRHFGRVPGLRIIQA